MQRGIDKWAPMSDKWWRCIVESNGVEYQLDAARSSRQGTVTLDGTAPQAVTALRPWLRECEGLQGRMWEEYREARA